MKYIPPGLVVVIVGMTLTSLSTIVVALRYAVAISSLGGPFPNTGFEDTIVVTFSWARWASRTILC